MKKGLLSLALLASATVNAQLPANSFGQDFTVTAYQSWLSAAGMNNNGTYTLYDYLDQGYTVFVDVSATWCGPCWNYHNTGALEDLYMNHGPAGQPGVSGTTTDNVMVIWLDGDGTTADATMLDGSGSIGNWIEPTVGNQIQFPMANPISATATQINNDYAIGYFPTIYKICPNRLVTEVGQLDAAGLLASVGTCPPPASDPADAAMISYDAVTEFCPGSSLTPVVTIQNNGTNAMTSATVTVTLNGTTVSTGSFSGSLGTYETAPVNCTAIAAPTSGTLVATVTTSGDASASNGSVTKTLVSAPVGTSTNATAKITTDAYGSEFTWNIKNSAGTTVASGGPYTDAAAAGAYPQADANFTLVSNECYSINLIDSYGDGFDSGYGDGAFKVQVGGSDLVTFGAFTTDAATKKMATGSLGINDASELISMSVFPNPASTNVTVSFEGKGGEYKVAITDLVGRTVANEVLSNATGSTEVSMSTSELKAGNYLVTITNGSTTYTQNLMVK